VSIWTTRHHRAVLGIIGLTAGFLVVESFRQPTWIADPPTTGVRAAEVEDKLDPNTATAADLAAIAGLGETRAHQIVEYREEASRHRPGTAVFRSPDDLLAIKGIGVGTVKNMEPFLVFPNTGPTPGSGLR
jgi:hypothetical protein